MCHVFDFIIHLLDDEWTGRLIFFGGQCRWLFLMCGNNFWLTGIYVAVLLGYKLQCGSKNPFNFSHSSIFIWHHLIHLISPSISLQVVTKSTQRALIWKHIKEFILVSTQCLIKLRLHRICFMTNFDHNWYLSMTIYMSSLVPELLFLNQFMSFLRSFYRILFQVYLKMD